MLVLSRTRDQTVMIGDNIEVTVVDIRGDKVRMGINAPRTISVHRKEVYDQIKKENVAASQIKPQDLKDLPAAPPPGPTLVGAAPVIPVNEFAIEPRISLITLGVADLQRSTDFYHGRLGWPLSSASNPHVSFIRSGGCILSLYPKEKLAEE